MLKKTAAALCAAGLIAALTFLPAPGADAGRAMCDPQYSILCQGLVDWWSFEEYTNNIRHGAFRNAPLFERDGYSVTASNAQYKFGSWAAYPNGTAYNHFRTYRYGNLPGYSTVAAWVYLSDNAGNQIIASTHAQDTVVNDGQGFGQKFWITGQKLQLVTYEDETNTTLTVNHATTVTTGSWHLVVFTLSPFGPYGKARGCISLDGGAFTCGSLAYNMKRNYGDLDVGGSATEVLKGYIDGFGIWSRAWDTNDVAWYWNGGSGRAFPF